MLDFSVTTYCEVYMVDVEECVREIRETVHRETMLTVSAGIAPNKVRNAAPLLMSASFTLPASQMLAKVTPSASPPQGLCLT